MERYEKPVMEILDIEDDVLLTSGGVCFEDTIGCSQDGTGCQDNEGPMMPV
jgi:hypothetical protein